MPNEEGTCTQFLPLHDCFQTIRNTTSQSNLPSLTSLLQHSPNPWFLLRNRRGNAEVTGSNSVKALIFFRLLPCNCLNWKIYCDDHSSLSFYWNVDNKERQQIGDLGLS